MNPAINASNRQACYDNEHATSISVASIRHTAAPSDARPRPIHYHSPMAFRFFRRMKVAPGVSLNFSKSGVSPSLGAPGARVTLGRQGVRKTVGLPGTGMYYTKLEGRSSTAPSKEPGRSGGNRQRRSRSRQPRSHERAEPPPPNHDLDLNFFERLFTPARAEAFVDGCRAYVEGDRARALSRFERADSIADADFLAGILLIDAGRLEPARDRLAAAADNPRRLGADFAERGLSVSVTLPITEHFAALLEPDRRGTLLALAEVHQLLEQPDEAARCLERIRRARGSSDDVLVNLSLAELILELHPHDRRVAKRVVKAAADTENESEAHAALLLYKAHALRTLGLHTAARDTLTAALRKKKDRGDELRRAIRYERALVYQELGRASRARAELEKIYAEDPEHEDVARRLGVD